MKNQALLGIEIGTQSTKAALINLKGEVLCSFSTPIDMETPYPGWAGQDPRTWWQSTSHNIQSIFANERFSPAQVLAIGVSGQMHGAVHLKSSNRVVVSSKLSTIMAAVQKAPYGIRSRRIFIRKRFKLSLALKVVSLVRRYWRELGLVSIRTLPLEQKLVYDGTKSTFPDMNLQNTIRDCSTFSKIFMTFYRTPIMN